MSCTSAPEILSNTTETFLNKCEIPIIDLEHIVNNTCPQKGALEQVGSKLVEAFSEKGLALLVNHGVPDFKLKAAYRAMGAFCELADEDKSKYESVAPSYHGYVKPGDEKLYSKPEEMEVRHSFNITAYNEKLPEAEVPGFRSTIDELAKDLKQLTATLLTALAMGLELPPDFLLKKHAHLLEKGNGSTLRLLYYPPLENLKPGITRCGPHCDYGTFTLLSQDSEGGLEIQNPDGEHWGRVGHLPGAILVNSAEILSLWTNGALPALRHRVIVPECYGRGRHSIALFVHPDYDVQIQPFDSKFIKTSNNEETVAPCKLEEKKKDVLTAYQHLQKRFQETFTS